MIERDLLTGRAVRIDEPLLSGGERTGIVNGSRGWRGPEAVLDNGRHRQPIHRLSLNASHNRPALELAHFLAQIAVGTLRILVRLERHVPRAVVRKLARNEAGAVLASE